MNSFFQRTSSHWVKYGEYEYRQGEDGVLYLIPKSHAKPTVYDPLKDGETMVIDALNVGRIAMKEHSDKSMTKQLQQTVLDFVIKYGLLGFMTALPTTSQFMDYQAVYLPKNHFFERRNHVYL